MKTFISIIQLLTSLFLATQVWAWLRMLGSFWVNESLYIVESTFSTLFIVRFGVTSFIAILIPSAFVYWFSRKQTVWNQLIIYLFSGALFTVIYLLYVTEFLVSNIYYLLSNGPVILAAGVWASLVFFGINWLPIWETKNRRDKENFSSARRHIVSGMALTAGGVGLVGSLVGPYRILKKTGEYVELDLEKLKTGEYVVVELSGKPVWIIKRSPYVIQSLNSNNPDLLDPGSSHSRQPDEMRNKYRSLKPEYYIVYAICTHFGCSISHRPEGIADVCSGEFGSKPVLFCPCHNGVFDMAGRVYKGTPPKENLRIPDYSFVSEHVVRIYYPSIIERWNDVYSS